MHQWIFEPADRDALLANEAIRKAVPDYHAIIEIACVRSPEELFAVRQAYQVRYKRSLEEDVAAHTTGDFRKARNLTLIYHFKFLTGIKSTQS